MRPLTPRRQRLLPLLARASGTRYIGRGREKRRGGDAGGRPKGAGDEEGGAGRRPRIEQSNAYSPDEEGVAGVLWGEARGRKVRRMEEEKNLGGKEAREGGRRTETISDKLFTDSSTRRTKQEINKKEGDRQIQRKRERNRKDIEKRKEKGKDIS